MLKKTIYKLALTCKQATLLMELKDSNEISLLHKLRLSLHLKICKYCRIFKEKQNFLTRMIQAKQNMKTIFREDDVSIDKLKVKIIKQLVTKK